MAPARERRQFSRWGPSDRHRRPEGGELLKTGGFCRVDVRAASSHESRNSQLAMLRLLLLRHAKSDWNHPGLRDHDRPLAPRGLRGAPRMGRYLREHGLVPAAALVSTARRARHTAELVLEAAGAPANTLRLIPDLYGSSLDEIVEIVSEEGGSASPLLVVAHNPGMEDLVARFGGRHEHFPTAALAVVSVPASDWSGVLPATATLEALVRPRELPRTG